MALKIKKPMELVGLQTVMSIAVDQEKRIAALAEVYKGAQINIEELISAHTEHAGDLVAYEAALRKKIESMVVVSNTEGNGDGQDGQSSEENGQVITGVKAEG